MKTFHAVGWYFWGIRRVEPYPGAPGYEYRDERVFQPWGMSIQGESREQAVKLFWEHYYKMPHRGRPYDVEIDGTPIGVL